MRLTYEIGAPKRYRVRGYEVRCLLLPVFRAPLAVPLTIFASKN